MRGYGDAFWKRDRKKPPRSLLADYERRAAELTRRARKAHADLARRAGKARLLEPSQQHWLAVLRLGGELEFEPKSGAWKLDGQSLPPELGEWLQQQTTKVGERRVFEAAGAKAPRLAGLVEHKSERLVVRTDLGSERAAQLHALATALLPHLQERLDGAPTRPLVLVVFGKRADYTAYLEACGMGRWAVASGLAEYGTFQTLVCAEGKADDDLHALVLHELTHLFFFGTAPATMPDWYAEGFAESFGGQGTFSWDGKTLTVGGLMRKDRIAAVQAAPLPLRELLAGDAVALFAQGHEPAMKFYAQSWALQRFLLQPKGPWRDRFLHFEAQCRGAVLGAAQGQQRFGDPAPAQAVFERLFGPDLDQIEAAFKAWLAQL
jgi:hypothetical protein